MLEKIKEWAGVIALLAIVLTWLVPAPTQLGSGTRYPNGLSADSTAPSAGEVRGTTLTITSTASITGAVTLSGAVTSPTTTVERFTEGGTFLSTTSVTQTLNANDLIYNAGLYVTPNVVADMTFSLPASSTLSSFCANSGDRCSYLIHNATTTADTDLLVASGTGIDLQVATGTSPTILGVGPGDTLRLDFFRLPNTDFIANLEIWDDAD